MPQIQPPEPPQPGVLAVDPSKYVAQNIQGGPAMNSLMAGGDDKNDLMKILKMVLGGG